jgi:hypothetical protein
MEHSLQTKTLIIGSRTTGADLFRDLAVRELLGIPRENEVIDFGVSIDRHGLHAHDVNAYLWRQQFDVWTLARCPTR